MRRRYGYYWTKLILVPVVIGAAIVVFIWIGDSWWQMFTAAIFAFLFTQTAFLGHDAAHRQIFRSGRWNDWISLIIGDLFIGMSYGWWQHKHTRHHANPNRIASDPDIELPVVAFAPEQATRPRPALMRWVIAHQGVFFFPLLLLEGLSLHASSVHRVFMREKVQRRPVEIAFLTVRDVIAMMRWYASCGNRVRRWFSTSSRDSSDSTTAATACVDVEPAARTNGAPGNADEVMPASPRRAAAADSPSRAATPSTCRARSSCRRRSTTPAATNCSSRSARAR